ncbi:xanthine dehydrogenase accessory protein XdhC [Roseobacteraceae bacterium S113]
MSFDRSALERAVARHGRVARVVIAQIRGSSPREVGAAMLVWDGGQSGTIGGGALEYHAAAHALDGAGFTASQHALGPELGQCCGGSVRLVTEVFDAETLRNVPQQGLFARGAGPAPLALRRAQTALRNGRGISPAFADGWMIEEVMAPRQPLWIWGAGHVGRALVDVLAPLPDYALTWVDTGAERFPTRIPETVTAVPAADLGLVMDHAPPQAHHLVLTYSHAFDLELCHRGLLRGFASLGLIGSKTKWARFRTRLHQLGHSPEQIGRITCPIGDPTLGKHPQAIAVGVAAQYLMTRQVEGTAHDRRASQP